MPPPNTEQSIGSSFMGQGVGKALSNLMGLGGGSTAKAKLKIDVPGLDEFKRKVDETTTAINKLRGAFVSLSTSPKAFTESLIAANAQLATFTSAAAKMPGGRGSAVGGVGGMNPQAVTPYAESPTKPQRASDGAGDTGAAAAVGRDGAGWAAVGAAVAKSVDVALGRIQRGATTGMAIDVYGARTALSTGVSAQDMYKRLGRSGGGAMPFYGTGPDIAQSLNAMATMGNVFGGTGLGGQRGQAAATSIQMLQNLEPGMTSQQAQGIQSGLQSNVQGQNQGAAIFGAAALMYKPGGGLKTMDEYYNGILKGIEARRTGDKRGVPFTKDELITIRVPGSNIYSMFAQLQWGDDQISAFFDWAIAKATVGPGFTGTEQQINQARGGKSLATAGQKTQTAQAARDTQFLGDQYKNLQTQQQREMEQIRLLGSIDQSLKFGFGILEKLPFPGVVKGAVGFAQKFLGGLVGDPGDSGYTQLNPDLRGRVGAMMAANPNLRITSGRRTAMEQKRMYEGGHPFAAPPGKSQHTRGAAVDIGPRNQLPWLTANAGRFGLDHAGGMGEPWHVQLAGTLTGDAGVSADEWAAQQRALGQALATSEASAAYTQLSADIASGKLTAKKTDGAFTPGTVTPGAAGTGTSGPPSDKPISVKDVVQALYNAGVTDPTALIDLAAIPARESGYISTKTNIHDVGQPGGEMSYGLWQVNIGPGGNMNTLKKVTGSDDYHQLFDLNTSAAVVAEMWKRSGLYPWGPYKKMSPLAGVPDSAVADATAAAKELGYITGDIGAPFRSPGGGGATTVHSSPMTFNNTFNIPVGNRGGAGIDMDALVNQIAARLEDAMRRVQTTRR